MRKRPLLWLVIAMLGAVAGWVFLKPDGPRKRLRAQHLRQVNGIYVVSGNTTNAPH